MQSSKGELARSAIPKCGPMEWKTEALSVLHFKLEEMSCWFSYGQHSPSTVHRGRQGQLRWRTAALCHRIFDIECPEWVGFDPSSARRERRLCRPYPTPVSGARKFWQKNRPTQIDRCSAANARSRLGTRQSPPPGDGSLPTPMHMSRLCTVEVAVMARRQHRRGIQRDGHSLNWT
jgi:hypothetical protein